MEKAALLSVSDKTGVVDLARCFAEQGYTLLSTSGTLHCLRESGLEVLSIADYTGQAEILDGRVKTLHPKIHAGLLARRDDPGHLRELKDSGIIPIDAAVINLYPFIEKLKEKGGDAPLAEMVEYVDIGGPTMLRSAAKNLTGVAAIVDPSDYPRVIEALREHGSVPLELRLFLAEKVFRVLADYNLQIAKYISSKSGSGATAGVVLEKVADLRYGENPHQEAGFFRELRAVPSWNLLSGKALSYNNLLDLDAGLSLIRSFVAAAGSDQGQAPTVALLKHLNPCGLAQADSALEALCRAQAGDPRSHFGGIVAVSVEVDAALAEKIAESFYELVVAPGFSEEALSILTRKQALRLIAYDVDAYPESRYQDQREIRSVEGGVLLQQHDVASSKLSAEMVVSEAQPDQHMLRELEFVWLSCRHVKSNAIAISKERSLIGVGAGQMSRVDSAELAVARATFHGHDMKGSVAASDAFFPFPDALEGLADAGVVAVVAPGGAKRDDDVIAAANKKGIVLLYAPTRHFRH
jgi:phosphoribosylaminoimidazolecarboxamide formyltransferase/IMP cyclohydrolase